MSGPGADPRRYALFSFSDFGEVVPGGGWSDFRGRFPTVALARAAASVEYESHHVVDLEVSQIVAVGDREFRRDRDGQRFDSIVWESVDPPIGGAS